MAITDDHPADHSDGEASGAEVQANREAAGEPVGVDFLKVVDSIEVRNEAFIGALQRNSWQQNIKAYRNEHAERSKYRSDVYRDRSKNFRPKTRSAVRKNMATAAQALFSNADVVAVTAEHDSDPRKQASAAVIKEILNYRLDRTAARSGVPWFLTSTGAVQDAQIHGIVVSKQYWEYQEVEEPTDPYEIQALHEETGEPLVETDEATGEPVLDPETGEPIPKMTTANTRRFVTKDRPFIDLIPPENVMIDPAAPWYAPAQASSYFCVRFPMTLDDVQTMLKNPGKGREVWLDVPEDVLKQAVGDYTAKGVRVARTAGTDTLDNRAEEIPGSTIVWMIENFIRVGGVDYHFWSVGHRAFASKIRTTRQAYPEQFGERPYAYGYGAIEAHNPFPMAPVESWQPMQREMNDIVNLRLDTMKQALSPIAKVKSGSLFDWKQLQRRGGANATIIVQKMDDLEFDRAPDATSSSYAEMNYLNADFDDLAGSFSGSSVQTNRQLNETVGGMRLLSGAANATTEFDLRVFVETWVEVAIRQVARCIQYFESDETVLSLAGDRAKLFERFGVQDPLTDHDLLTELSVRVNVGMGAADPMQGLQKLAAGMKMLSEMVPFMDKKYKINGEEILKEIMGKIGYNDGMRFFVMDDQGGQPPPEQMKAMMDAQLEKMKTQAQVAIAQSTNKSREDIAKMQAIVSLIDTMISQSAKASQQALQLEHTGASDAARNLIDIFREHSRTTATLGDQASQAEQARQSAMMEAAAASGAPQAA